MLDKAKTLKGYKLHSLDGEIGEEKNFSSMTSIGLFGIWLETQVTGLLANSLSLC
ncbi:MAG: hypothetical protein ACYDA4_13440 [Ignavibacteriaceae bacterium]